VVRAMIGVNIFAALVGPFDYLCKTNYFYLLSKPANPSLLDFLGPWPVYIAGTEVVALILFLLLYLPVRLSRNVKAVVKVAIRAWVYQPMLKPRSDMKRTAGSKLPN
jgi:uncharacterized membrane protein YwaF